MPIPPRYSFITTCKGRLDHLRVTLPHILAQPDSETIVVDYDCPQNTAEVLAREFTTVRVVKVADAPLFNQPDARNRGAEIASGDRLVFIDADVVPRADFIAAVDRHVSAEEQGTFYRFRSLGDAAYTAAGTCIVARSDCQAVGGYDTAFRNYGGDDDDFYARLQLHGCAMELLDSALIADVLVHDDRTRTRFLPHGPLAENQRINAAYVVVKNTLLRQVGELDLEQRRTLYRLIEDVVRQSFGSDNRPVHFTIELPADPVFMPVVGWRIQRHFVFDLTPARIESAESDEVGSEESAP